MRRRSLASLLALLLAAACLVGCGSRGAFWDEPLETDGPIVAAGQLAFLNRTAAIASWIEPGSGEPPQSRAVIASPRAFAAWAEGVLVLGGSGDAPALDALGLPGGARRRIAIEVAWDRIAVSPDGMRAVLLFDPDATPAKNAAPVRNPNQIGVVDLAAGSAVTVVVQTESLAPRQVVFSPDAAWAAVLYDNAVAFVDLERPERRRTVPLKLRDGTALRPVEATFSPEGGFLFVRAAGTDDVLALELVDGGDVLDVAINFLFVAGATGLQDIAVSAPLGNAVVALYRNAVTLLDATGDTSATRAASLAVRLDRILDLGDGILLLHASPDGSFDRQALAAWEPLTGRLVVDRLERPIIADPVVAGPGEPGAAFLPQSGQGNGALTVATVVREPARLRLELQALQLAGQPTSVAADPVRGVAYLGLDLLPVDSWEDEGVDETGTGGIASVAAGSLASGGLLVDAPVRQLGVVGDHLFALHDDFRGDLTLIPQDDLRREAALRYEAVFMSGLLDRGENR